MKEFMPYIIIVLVLCLAIYSYWITDTLINTKRDNKEMQIQLKESLEYEKRLEFIIDELNAERKEHSLELIRRKNARDSIQNLIENLRHQQDILLKQPIPPMSKQDRDRLLKQLENEAGITP